MSSPYLVDAVPEVEVTR